MNIVYQVIGWYMIISGLSSLTIVFVLLYFSRKETHGADPVPGRSAVRFDRWS